MSALQKMLSAMQGDHDPAPGTYRDAVIELDRHITDAFDAAVKAAQLKGKLEAYQNFAKAFRETQRRAGVTDDAPVVPLSALPTMCSLCGEREARVWDDGLPYCKRCAHDEGVSFGGKV